MRLHVAPFLPLSTLVVGMLGCGLAASVRFDKRGIARPDAQRLIIEGMNHILKNVPLDRALQISSYSDPGKPVVKELIQGVATFVGAARLRKAR